MVYTADFTTIEEGLFKAHGEEVDLFAVVASVGPALPSYAFDPYVAREICLKDESRIGFLRIVNDPEEKDGPRLLDADLRNNFVMIIRALVNRDRGCFEEGENTRITLIENGAYPWIPNLEAVRSELRKDYRAHDAIKLAVNAQAYENKQMEPKKMGICKPNTMKQIYNYMLNGNRMCHVIDEYENICSCGSDLV
ncbi:unnamed protein product [Urochloa humidicola]